MNSWKFYLLSADECEYSNTAKLGAWRHGWEREDRVTWVGTDESNGETFNLENICRQKWILEIISTAVLSLISESLWIQYFSREGLNFINSNPSKCLFQLNIGIPSLTKCCNQHDRCYETCGKSKNDCDEEFQYCLSKICRDVQKTLGLAQHIQGKLIWWDGNECSL